MPTQPQLQPEPTTIGMYLQWARTQKGLELSDVEDRTKIRAKYLQALEAEDWDVLPSSSYARGFLGTYAALLGLDADGLIDEYRRQVETDAPTANLSAYGEPVIEGRRRTSAPRRPLGPLVAAGIALLAVIVVILLILSGSGNGQDKSGANRQGSGSGQASHGATSPQSGSAAGTTLPLKLHAKTGMRVCLVAAGGTPLVDAQTLTAGAREGPFNAVGYRLDVQTGGVVKVKLGHQIQRLASARPASYRVSGATIRSIPYRGGACP